MSSDAPPLDPQALAERAVAVFAEHFDTRPTHAVLAPGRVNLMGEHTDYNDGYVLTMAIDRHTAIAARVNHSRRCRVVAADVEGGEMATFFVDDALAAGRTTWSNYVKGVIAQFLANGQMIPPFDAVIVSNIPMAAGLGSSAAIEVATATLIESLMGIRLDPARKAAWCREAERQFIGSPRRLMGQLSATLNPMAGGLMIDCRTFDTRPIRIDDTQVSIVVADSGVRHDLAEGEHMLRHEQCGDAVRALAERYPHIAALRDAKLNELIAVRDAIDAIAFRRARHVILENQRVLMVADALVSGYYETAGFLMYESHRSLRDDYEVSCAELDMLVRLAVEMPGVYGARMTGGGFGGATVTLCRADAVDRVIDELTTGYRTHTGREADCFTVHPAGPARAVTLHGMP